MLYSALVENKFILEIIYTLAIGIICSIIVLRTDKFFKLSFHQGIRYFRNAFFFYGLAFVTRYIFGFLSDSSLDYYHILGVVFEYLFMMAGFFFLYSLIWKKFEAQEFSSLFNSRIILFHMMAIVIVALDLIWHTYFFMFASQILIFFYTAIIACSNYSKIRKKFSKFYLFAMLINLSAWVLNLLVALYFNWDKSLMIAVGMINVSFFLLFLYGVVKITSKWQPKNVKD